MKRFIEREDQSQGTLFPERLDDYIAEDNPVRVIEAFVEELDLYKLGFDGMPSGHPSLSASRQCHSWPEVMRIRLNSAIQSLREEVPFLWRSTSF